MGPQDGFGFPSDTEYDGAFEIFFLWSDSADVKRVGQYFRTRNAFGLGSVGGVETRKPFATRVFRNEVVRTV